MKSALNKLLNQLEKSEIDAALITMPENIRYYSGFTGSSGWLLIHPLARYLITDFRYIEQGKQECPEYKIANAPGQKAFQFLNDVCKGLGIYTIWFEEEHLSFEIYSQIKDVLKDVNLQPSKGVISRNRMVKTPEEILYIQKSASLADMGFSYLLNIIKPGITEKEVALELEIFLKRNGCEGLSFKTIAASGENAALPHAQPSERVLQSGDLLVLDFGCINDGYCSDMTRTIAIGDLDPELEEIYQIVLEAQLKVLKGLKPGITGVEADRLAREHISDAGFGEYFGHGLGHGVGLQIHELPTLSQRGTDNLLPGMVVTVEPGIYLPGRGGVRIEDLIVITDDGINNLTKSPKELIKL